MHISPNLARISKESMFELLKNRYIKSYDSLQQHGEYENLLIFKEAFDVIRLYESLLLRAKSGELPTKKKYENMSIDSQEKFKKNISSLLQYKSNFLPEWSGLEVSVFRKIMNFLNEIDTQNRYNKQTNIVSLFNDYFRKKKFCVDQLGYLYSSDTEEITTNYFTISEKLEYVLKSDETVKETFILSDEEQDYFKYFNDILEQKEQVYIFCIDIQLYAPSNNYNNNYSNLFESLKYKIDSIYQLIIKIEKLQNLLLKIEPMQKIGLNLHCVLMFDYKYSNFSEDGIISQLDKKMKSTIGLSPKSYFIVNWNNFIRNYCEDSVIGLIKNKDFQSRSKCWHWVYSYFFQ
jgi:hypothetical protein